MNSPRIGINPDGASSVSQPIIGFTDQTVLTTWMWMQVKALIVIIAEMSIPVCKLYFSKSIVAEKYLQFIMPLNCEGVLL